MTQFVQGIQAAEPGIHDFLTANNLSLIADTITCHWDTRHWNLDNDANILDYWDLTTPEEFWGRHPSEPPLQRHYLVWGTIPAHLQKNMATILQQSLEHARDLASENGRDGR